MTRINRKYGFIQPQVGYARTTLFCVLVVGLMLFLGQITLAIQNNQIYQSQLTDHQESFESAGWIITGISK